MSPSKKLIEIEQNDEHADSAVEALDKVAQSIAAFTEVFGKSLELEKEHVKVEREKFSKLYEIVIEGNGKESLRSTVSRHETYLSNINRLTWLVIAQFIVMLFAFAYSVFEHLTAVP